MFCPKCGKELPDGSAFCSSCGTNVSTMGGPAATPKQPSAAGAAFSGLGGFLKAYFASPVQATRNTLAKKDIASPLILMGVQIVGCMLMILGFFLKINMMFGGYGSVPFHVWFVGGLLSDAICVAVFVLLLFGGSKILQSSCTFQDVVIACGCHSVFITALMVITFLGFLISMEVGLWLFILTVVLWIALGVSSFQLITPEMESGKSWLVYLGVVAVTMIITALLLDNVVFPAVSGSPVGMSSLFKTGFAYMLS